MSVPVRWRSVWGRTITTLLAGAAAAIGARKSAVRAPARSRREAVALRGANPGSIAPPVSVEQRREPPAVAGRERVPLAELGEELDHHLPRLLAPLGIAGPLEQDLEGALVVAGTQRRRHLLVVDRARRPAAWSARRGTPRPRGATARPTNSATTSPCRKALTAGMPETWKRSASSLLASTSTLASATCAPRPPPRAPASAAGRAGTTPPRSRRRPARSAERSITSAANVSSVTSISS